MIQEIRMIIVWILFCLILIAGAFAWGRLYEVNRDQNIHRLQEQIKDHEGRITAVEGPAPRRK
jgi:hypothetical protein